jgi:[protein-PII] uridylyltransferase
LAAELLAQGPLPPPRGGRVSRRVRHFPIPPAVEIRPDERGAYHSLTIVASDRPGLLYSVARQLSDYRLNLHSAKINTLGDRAEDVFLVSGPALSDSKAVLKLEQQLLAELQL